MLVIIFGCCCKNFDLNPVFRMLVSDANVKRWWMLVTKMKVTNIFSPTSVTNHVGVKILCWRFYDGDSFKIGHFVNLENRERSNGQVW